ncbi:MAG: prenyltransferase/squalene oxidase repeat-containing protein [Planctomycetota bacterium]
MRSPLIASSFAVILAVAVGAQGTPQLPRGVRPETQIAINRGIDWLASQQNRDGSWRNAGGDGGNPVAMTALAGMSLVASGSTPTRGPRWQEVREAVEWTLVRAEAGDGFITAPGEGQPMFGHGFATMLLASVYGMEEDERHQKRIKRVLDRAVGTISSAQSTAGGWIYYPGMNDDEGSVTITQMQALRAARMAGIVVDKRTIDRGVDYVKRCRNRDGGIRYKLGMSGESRAPITAAGIAVLYNAGRYDDTEFVDGAFAFCQKRIAIAADNTGHHFYTHLYWSQALYQRGGSEWDDYYDAMSAWLCERQRPDGAWEGDHVGPTYGTAVALLILQLPYALVPIYQR